MSQVFHALLNDYKEKVFRNIFITHPRLFQATGMLASNDESTIRTHHTYNIHTHEIHETDAYAETMQTHSGMVKWRDWQLNGTKCASVYVYTQNWKPPTGLFWKHLRQRQIRVRRVRR